MQVKRYVSNPVTIEAIQWDGDANSAATIIQWVLSNGGTAAYFCKTPDEDGGCTEQPEDHDLAISTLEGVMHADSGWWIIRGTKGEFYPVRDDIFREKYHLANDNSVADG